jgi:hypothetical protein
MTTRDRSGYDHIEELHEKAMRQPDGPMKLALLEECVRLADSHQDPVIGDSIRGDLVKTATFTGAPEKALAAFSWRLMQCDRNPLEFDEASLLWEYKWIADSLGGFPEISRQQIEAILDDMTNRYQRCGASLRPIHKLRCTLAMDMCDTKMARTCFSRWKRAPRAWPSDCVACDQNSMVRFQAAVAKDEEALELARPILAGEQACAEIPQATLAHVLLPLVRLHREVEAMALHHRGYRMISDNRKFLPEVAEHLVFLVLTDNLAKAVKLFEKHIEWALSATDLKAKFEMYNAARFLLEQLAAGGKEKVRLRLPQQFAEFESEVGYVVAALRRWFDAAAAELAAKFDARNGNDGFTKALRKVRKWKKLVRPCPLRPGNDGA